MAKTCSRCGVTLLVDTEVDRKYQNGPGGFIGFNAGGKALSYMDQKQRDIDASGVSCAVCGKNYCVKCMKAHGRPHPVSGGLACLDCGGRMAKFLG